jgi:ParB/RepB/Spo0J family partition protein
VIKREATFTAIPVNKIVSESNRKHGGMGNIEILSESIKAEGLINPPTVVASEDGTYRVVAGRRRVEAVRQLKWKEVPVMIVEEADAERLESIGLAENVNRQEMHPLDEAAIFKRLLEKGTAIEDIAAYYDRTVSGIHHRARLMDLSDELGGMFREGKIKLSGAALLASLPAGDQAKFFKKYESRSSVSNWDISDFIHQAQRYVIAWIADTECEKCKKRTHNADPGLFEEFSGLKDVCFDQNCYAEKWKKLIESFIAKEETILRTENNIILDKNIPNFFPKKTESLVVGEVEYKLLSHQKHTWHKTSKKANKNTAWLVTTPDAFDAFAVNIQRVEYGAFERPTYGSYSAPSDPVKDFLIDQVADVAIEDQKAVAERVKAKYERPLNLINEVRSAILRAVILRRLEMENRENMAAIYLEDKYSGQDDNTGEHKEFDDDFDRDVFTIIFGPAGITHISDIPKESLIERLFLFLAATSFRINDIPDLDKSDEKWKEIEESLFWKFAQMTREEYIAMYRETLSAAIKATETPEQNQDEAEEEIANAE